MTQNGENSDAGVNGREAVDKCDGDRVSLAVVRELVIRRHRDQSPRRNAQRIENLNRRRRPNVKIDKLIKVGFHVEYDTLM